MHFSDNDIERFAAWSGDHNPLHVDAEFARAAGVGRPTVHGVLLAIGAIGAIRTRSAAPLKTLEIDFRGTVLPDATCDTEAILQPDGLSISLRQDDVEVATIHGTLGRHDDHDCEADLSWVRLIEAHSELQERARRSAPVVRDFDSLSTGIESVGSYATDPPPETATASGYITPVQARVLGLCSYLAGMEFPGLRSWITRLTLQFVATNIDDNVLWYRARADRFDRHLRILDTRLEVATPDGRLVAFGE